MLALKISGIQKIKILFLFINHEENQGFKFTIKQLHRSYTLYIEEGHMYRGFLYSVKTYDFVFGLNKIH